MQIVEHDQRAELERGIDRPAGGAPDDGARAELVQCPDVRAVGDLVGEPGVAGAVTRDVQHLGAGEPPARERGRTERRIDRQVLDVIEAGQRVVPEPVMIATATVRDATSWMTPAGRDQPGPWILLYDADCGFCRWALSLVLGLDRGRRLVPVALGSPLADELLADLAMEERARSWHLVAPGGERTSAGAAAPPLLRCCRADACRRSSSPRPRR